MIRLPDTAVGMVRELPVDAHDFETLAEAIAALAYGERFSSQKRGRARRGREKAALTPDDNKRRM